MTGKSFVLDLLAIFIAVVLADMVTDWLKAKGYTLAAQ